MKINQTSNITDKQRKTNFLVQFCQKEAIFSTVIIFLNAVNFFPPKLKISSFPVCAAF